MQTCIAVARRSKRNSICFLVEQSQRPHAGGGRRCSFQVELSYPSRSQRTMNNPNVAFSCMCFDEYHTLHQALCVNGCTPRVDYLAHRFLVAVPPFHGPATGSIRVPGELNSMPVLFSTEAGKQFVHSLFEGVWSVVKEGKYFSNIAEENIYVSREGDARFHNVQILYQGTKDQRANRARQNYHQVCSIAIRKFKDTASLVGHTDVIPCDINHLFQRVMADKMLYNIGLYHMHISLVPIGVGQLAFFKMHDHLMTIDDQGRNSILDNLHGCLEFTTNINGTPNWVMEVLKNKLLRDVYYYKPANYRVNDYNISIRLGIVVNDVRKKRTDPKAKNEYDELVKRTKVAIFLDFLRNRTAHRMQSWLVGTLRCSTLLSLISQTSFDCLSKLL